MGAKIRRNTSPKKATSEDNFGMIEVPGSFGAQKRPASVVAENGANHNLMRGGLMPNILEAATDIPRGDQHEIAKCYLRLTAVQMAQAVQNRDLYIGLARQYGLTYRAIGDELGVSEARVRQILAGT